MGVRVLKVENLDFDSLMSFRRLVHEWQDKMTPREIAGKVKTFFHFYGINRHKSKQSNAKSALDT